MTATNCVQFPPPPPFFSGIVPPFNGVLSFQWLAGLHYLLMIMHSDPLFTIVI